MTIEVIGASHKTSTLEVRECLAVSSERLPEALFEMRNACGLEELVVISTCNRVEYYFRSPNGGAAVGHHLASTGGLSSDAVRANIYHLRGAQTVRHLFAVASGLDSMVVGETEVLGQVKTAYDAALAAATTGVVFNSLFQRAIAAAKRVHASTKLSRGHTSVGSVSAALIKRELGSLEGKRVLAIGAGAMAENVLSHVAAAAGSLVVANRTPRRAAALAEKFGGKSVGLEDLDALIGDADVAVTSTSGESFVLSHDMVAGASNRSAPLVILDISVPRNVEPSAGTLPGVRLFNIDDLQELAEESRVLREKEATAAARLIDTEVAAFEEWLSSRQVTPVVTKLTDRVRAAESAEVEKALANIRRGSNPEDEVRKLAERLSNQFLHTPLAALKSAASDDERAERLSAAARELHGIGDNGKQEES